ncbi:MAG: D-2-hydroxyacid dehydrogenase [Alphaproteobacteria bacterium]|nr:D-2-hydroxyacid dehydrogenase [Alphaproteobacteria bacterium]
MSQGKERLVVFVATPLEEPYVERIRAVAPDRLEVIAEPDLWPPLLYVADHKGEPSFRRNAEQEARWRRHLARAEVLWDFAPKDADGKGGMALAPKVRWVQTTSSGVGQLVKDLGFQDSDLLVTNARGVHAGPLAEFVFMALLAHVKRLAHLRREQAVRHWERYCGDELEGRTLAVIGAGQVGARVARVGRAFGMRVVGSTRDARPERAAALGLDALYPPDRLHAMLGEADAVVLSAPHTPETENLVDAAAFAAMKDGAVFVNIGRGQSVDEGAMVEALRRGKLAFAALDVFAQEPLPADSPLWAMENVLICPHSASTVHAENGRITDIFCHNLRCYLDGRPDAMRNILDKRRMY